jgi:hypothetical protein
MREIGRVPANPSVRVDSRLYPTVAGFAEQAETAVVLPSEIVNERLYAIGDRAYASVLSGESEVEEAVCRFGIEVATMQGYGRDDVVLPAGCVIPETGEHSEQSRAAASVEWLGPAANE